MEISSKRFIHYLTAMNFVVMMDMDGGYAVAAFNSKPATQEWIACQDSPDLYYYITEE